MNLKHLKQWIEGMQNLDILRQALRNRPVDSVHHRKVGNVLESDMNVCSNMLGEMKRRILIIEDLSDKIEKYMSSIEEYIAYLEKKGIVYMVDKHSTDEVKKDPDSTPAENQDRPQKAEPQDAPPSTPLPDTPREALEAKQPQPQRAVKNKPVQRRNAARS